MNKAMQNMQLFKKRPVRYGVITKLLPCSDINFLYGAAIGNNNLCFIKITTQPLFARPQKAAFLIEHLQLRCKFCKLRLQTLFLRSQGSLNCLVASLQAVEPLAHVSAANVLAWLKGNSYLNDICI
ncbi:MAG: hypothetical protein QXL94_04550 [Candidatus Parvarchaeum sp.]